MLTILVELMHSVIGPVIAAFSGVLLIWTSADVLTHKNLPRKGLWLWFILGVQPAGAIVYLITGQSHTLPWVYRFLKKFLWGTAPPSSDQAAQPATLAVQVYQPYQGGYQSQPDQSLLEGQSSEGEPADHYDDYEQPQAMYPEMQQ